MMQLQHTVPVQITNIQGQASRGSVEHRIWSKKEKTQRGLKALGICWGLAVFFVFIPLVHFVLVPLFILIGPGVAFWIAGQNEVILGGKGQCPTCNKEFEIVRTAVKWPLSDMCNHCNSELKINKLA